MDIILLMKTEFENLSLIRKLPKLYGEYLNNIQMVFQSIGLLTGFLKMEFIVYPIITSTIMCIVRMENCFINGETHQSELYLPEIIIMEIWYSISMNPGFPEEKNGVIFWMKRSGLSLRKHMSRLSAEICLIRHKSG